MLNISDQLSLGIYNTKGRDRFQNDFQSMDPPF